MIPRTPGNRVDVIFYEILARGLGFIAYNGFERWYDESSPDRHLHKPWIQHF